VADVIEVQAQWDPEAEVWWAESADLPGLVSEAPTLEALINRVSLAIPDLLTAGQGATTEQQSDAARDVPRGSHGGDRRLMPA